MPVAPNHSGNLPRVFAECPECHKKGLYRYGGTIMTKRDGLLDGLVPGRRCKYCGHRIEDMTQPEYVAYLNRSMRPIIEDRLGLPLLHAEPDLLPDGVTFAEDKERNGAFKSLTVTECKGGLETVVTLDRAKLVELYRMLWIDPSLARDANIRPTRRGAL